MALPDLINTIKKSHQFSIADLIKENELIPCVHIILIARSAIAPIQILTQLLIIVLCNRAVLFL